MKVFSSQSSAVSRRVFSSALCTLLYALCFSAEAQQQEKVPRIGFLGSLSGSSDERVEAFRQELRELGYVEGKNIIIEYRYADGKLERLPSLAAELVRLKVDILVARGAPAAHAAKNATSTIPIVIGNAADPVGTGLVASLARPGGNITGLSDFNSGVITRRLELLKEVLPTVSRIATFWNPGNPTNQPQLKDIQAVAHAELVSLKVDVIVAGSTQSIDAVKQATKTIPIVFPVTFDPVASGFVASLARSGANLTGLSTVNPDAAAKRVELLKELMPRISRVAVLRNPTNSGSQFVLKETEAGAKQLGIRLQTLEARSPDDLEGAFRAATKEQAGALIVVIDVLFSTERKRIGDLGIKYRLPGISMRVSSWRPAA